MFWECRLQYCIDENKLLHLAASYNNIGGVYFRKGDPDLDLDLDNSLGYYRQALEIRKAQAPNSFEQKLSIGRESRTSLRFKTKSKLTNPNHT